MPQASSPSPTFPYLGHYTEPHIQKDPKLGSIPYCCLLEIPNKFIFELRFRSAVDETMGYTREQEKTQCARAPFLAAPFTHSILGAP